MTDSEMNDIVGAIVEGIAPGIKMYVEKCISDSLAARKINPKPQLKEVASNQLKSFLFGDEESVPDVPEQRGYVVPKKVKTLMENDITSEDISVDEMLGPIKTEISSVGNSNGRSVMSEKSPYDIGMEDILEQVHNPKPVKLNTSAVKESANTNYSDFLNALDEASPSVTDNNNKKVSFI